MLKNHWHEWSIALVLTDIYISWYCTLIGLDKRIETIGRTHLFEGTGQECEQIGAQPWDP